ncbi:coniferyl aldehyde dehydrogenase [Pseudomonas sp. MDT1-16]
MNTDISVGDQTAIADMGRLLTLQRRAVLEQGTPDLKLRLDRLDRLSAALHGNRNQLAEAISHDFGNRARATSLLLDVLALLGSIAHNRANLHEWMKPDVQPDPVPGGQARVEFQPKGVIGVVSPWNVPVQLAIGPIIGILGAGNRALLKPSELTPVTAQALKELISGAFDESELAVVTGGAAVGAAFTALAFDHLLFTGSTAVGKHVARAAAENLVPLTLELGGKSPAIVGTTVNLEQATSRILTAKMLNCGQVCVSPDYVLVPQDKRDAFIEIASQTIGRLFPIQHGNPDYTTIVNERHFSRLNGLIEDAKAKGAKVLPLIAAGEAPVDPATRRISPTLVLDTTPDMQIMKEEIFGPLLPVIAYSSIDDAIDYVNARPRPLALYYFGQDEAQEQRVLSETISGGVTVNDCISHLTDENLPFGGVGESGMGHYHGGIYGFRTFSHAKAIYRQADVLPMAELLSPPFNSGTEAFFEQAFAAFAPK